MEFFSSVIIWLDILGSTSTGLRPQYCDICTDGLGDNSKLPLRNIIGCENWAMVLIREIAVLCDWNRQMSEEGVLSVPELAKRAGALNQLSQLSLFLIPQRIELRTYPLLTK